MPRKDWKNRRPHTRHQPVSGALQTTEDQPAKLVRIDLAGARIKVGLVFGSGCTGSSALLDLHDERLLLWSHGSFHFFFVEPA